MVFPFWVSTLKFASQIVLLIAYVLLKRNFLIITLVTDSPPPLSYKPDPSRLYRNLRGESRWNKIKWYFESILWINSWMFHFSWMWLVRAYWTLFSIMTIGHKLNNKAKLEALVQRNQTFALYMKSTATFNLCNGYDN